MKHFKKIALLLMSAVFLAVLPSGNVLKASAAEPTRHLIVYDSDGKWSWYVGGSTVDEAEPAEHWEPYYLEQAFKDGDILVIEGSSPDDGVQLNLGQHRISNLTIKPNASGINVQAGSIDECYILSNGSASITGTITNAYVYDAALVNFFSDIANLNIISSDVDVRICATINALGTVDHVIGKDDEGVYYEYYDIARGQLEMSEGYFKTNEAHYSTTPSASTQQKLQNPSQTSNASNANAYDKVPKTGDNIPVSLILAGIAAICFAGRVVLKKA